MRNRCCIVLMTLLATCVLTCVPTSMMAQEFSIGPPTVLNARADHVGIWVNSNVDRFDDSMTKSLQRLKIRSIRYGWQFGIFDATNLASVTHSPVDPHCQGYLGDGSGRLFENFGPQVVGDRLKTLGIDGFAVLATDGINYRGMADSAIGSLDRQSRIDFYSDAAAQWARWGRSQGFSHFEIGNENDLSGGDHTKEAIAPWDAIDYAQVASVYVDAIHAANPDAKCGINGGLRDAATTKKWFDDIFSAQPALATKLDFLVAHKYEFWLDHATWSQHADWDFGRIGNDFREAHAKHCAALPIQITELGSWKSGENEHHYRAVLATEMLGNVRLDEAIDHVIFWPTRWGKEGGVVEGDDNQLTAMGNGLLAYTQFAEPNLVFNQARGSVRCFASTGTDRSSVWLINHSGNRTEVSVSVPNEWSGSSSTLSAERWQLISPTDDPMASDTRLESIDDVPLEQLPESLHAKLVLRPCSATILRFNRPAQ